ncbi:MAG: hypothetical protein H6R02_2887, partial [Burkholderiaceae bacterium]|nr:hypothetical protein [Burkholderiaceae bacterium]
VLRGAARAQDQPAPRPAPSLLAPPERRRAPDTVAIALEVAARACESAGVDPKDLASVFACTQGDLAINDYMSATLASTPTLISPIRFTFGEGLLEALVQAQAGERPTLLVAYDIEARGPLAAMQPSRGIVGAGLVVSPRPSSTTQACIRYRTVGGSERTPPLARNAELVAGNAMAACLPFFEAVAMGENRMVRLGLSPALLLEVDFDFRTEHYGSSS